MIYFRYKIIKEITVMSRPILLDFAMPRITCDEKLFNYDYSRDMNVLKGDTSKLFIEADKKLSATLTETRIQRESDDEEYSFAELLTKTKQTRESDDEEYSFAELLTKTEQTRESDDDEYSLNELLTKTSENRESDDDETYSLCELLSKTFTERERDDEDDHYFNQ